MVVIEIEKNDLLNLIGKEIPQEELEELLLLIKVEPTFSDNKIECELSPDRPDMFSVEGIARAIKGFMNIKTEYKYPLTDSRFSMKKENVEARPQIACAVIENVKITDELIKSLMQIQEKLHETIGRNRKKVAIGIHDSDTITPPLTYKEEIPGNIKFVPLEDSKEMNLNEILENHPKGTKYAHLLKDHAKYPIIVDKEGVISFPPIINSERTKVREKTKNLFIDVTGTDEKAVNQVLNILVCNIAERSGSISTVKIDRKKYPNFEQKQVTMEVENIDRILGLGLSENEIVEILKRMLYEVSKAKAGKIEFSIPVYRADILHTIDIIEDIAIGYGYNNIAPLLPKIATIGSLSDKERFTMKLRELMIGIGFQEIMSFILTNPESNFKKMNIPEMKEVEIENPISSDYNICRNWLLPNLLKALSSNKHREYPQKIFEIGDVVVLDENKETKTRNVRKLAGVISYDNANLTEIKSVIESVLRNAGYDYSIKPYSHPSFIESRCGEIHVSGKHVGFFGEINPEVLINFNLEKPVIAFEIEVE